ncbi:MAG: sulfatase [Saprospiraceae bacterium]|nr:sulfatase [Saprospiraceae bacterium]
MRNYLILNHRKFTIHKISLLLLSILNLCCQNHTTDSKNEIQKPNILWIVAENIKLDLGCYGATNVLTPNLDSLAAKGVKYTHVFSTSPVCAPSRSALMTGMYQTSTDLHNMRSHRDDNFRLPEGVRPLTHRLQDAGYFTANISQIDTHIVGTGKLDLNFVNEGPIYQSEKWSDLSGHQPFFAQINLPEAEYDIYDRKSAEKERVKWVGEDIHPRIATPENVVPPPYYPDHPVVREEWARYLNSVSGIDIRVGYILKQLIKEGLDQNTIIIFFADNGRLEARGIHWLWDTGIHVPLIIHWPESVPSPPQYAAGRTNDQIISLLDLTATTLWIAGVEKPLGMQSRNFLGTSPDPPREYAFSARDRIDETEIRMRSVRGEQYHYIRNFTPGAGFLTLNRYKEKCFIVKPLMRELFAQGKLEGPAAELMQPFPEEQLYDTKNDPFEIHNLAFSELAEHQNALQSMRKTLDNWIEETDDQGGIIESREIVNPFIKEMHDWFGTPSWYLGDAMIKPLDTLQTN